MTTQLDLEIKTSRRAPRVTSADVAWFIDQLRGKTGWVTTTELGATTEAQKRRLRRIAEMANGQIISFPGSPGYKLLDNCTPTRRTPPVLPDLTKPPHVRSPKETRRMEAKLKPVWRRMHKLQLVEKETDPIGV